MFAAFLLAWIFLSFLRCLAGASSCHIKPSFKARSGICSGLADQGFGAGASASVGATVFACVIVFLQRVFLFFSFRARKMCCATFHPSVFGALECHEKRRNKLDKPRTVTGKSRYVTQKMGKSRKVALPCLRHFFVTFRWTTPFRALHIFPQDSC